MKPADFSKATFDALREELHGPRRKYCRDGKETFFVVRQKLDRLRLQAYNGWLLFGPGTTREVSQRCGMDILTFRPRTTELLAMGLVKLAEGQSKSKEGVYRASREAEWQAFSDDQQKGQMQLL